jgi:hypothetical protein
MVDGHPSITTHRQSSLARHASWAIAVVLTIGLGIWICAAEWRSAARAADYSAHAALTKEICDQLAAVPPGQPYPASLHELSLTFPDGGDVSLLDRFEYRCDGTSCTLKTELVWEETKRRLIVRTFPENVTD